MALTEDESFARALLRAAVDRARVVGFLERARAKGSSWHMLPGGLPDEMARFDRVNIAAAIARILGGDDDTITRRQSFVVRAAVTAIAFPIQAFDDRLLVHLEEGGIRTLFHHTVREFAAETHDSEYVMAVADACRLASFDLEDLMRRAIDENAPPDAILRAHADVLSELHSRIDPSQIVFGMSGVALLWIAATADLGTLPAESKTTEVFYEGTDA
ncbi:MAG: hypothetical protein R3F61_23010 [Myxococcota bacterium]